MARARQVLVLALLLLSAVGCQDPSPETTLYFSKGRVLLPNATINDKPVCLALDTGSEGTILFRPAADAIGLKVNDPPPDVTRDITLRPGEVIAPWSEICRLKIDQSEYSGRFRVFDAPAEMELSRDIDGVLGWPNIGGPLVHIDLSSGGIGDLQALPAAVRRWRQFPLTKEKVLGFTLSLPDGRPVPVLVDTGDSEGVTLSADLWQAWRRENPDAPLTRCACIYPASGLLVMEQGFAERLTVGDLTLHDVSVRGLPADVKFGDYEVHLGVEALQRVEMIVDRRHRVVYMQPRTGETAVPEHNRLGAVFVPDSRGASLVADVADGSPAAQAGIRDGDQLLRIGDLDATKWRTDPKVLPLHRFWSQKAGTELHLLVRRGRRELAFGVTLQDILASPKTSLSAE